MKTENEVKKMFNSRLALQKSLNADFALLKDQFYYTEMEKNAAALNVIRTILNYWSLEPFNIES